jgi:hypothetical protein
LQEKIQSNQLKSLPNITEGCVPQGKPFIAIIGDTGIILSYEPGQESITYYHTVAPRIMELIIRASSLGEPIDSSLKKLSVAYTNSPVPVQNAIFDGLKGVANNNFFSKNPVSYTVVEMGDQPGCFTIYSTDPINDVFFGELLSPSQ